MRATILKLITGLMLVAPLFLMPAFADPIEAPQQSVETKTASEECRDRCNRDYEMCAEEGQASDQSMNGRPSAGFSKNHCNASLSSCMTRCRGV